jgi:hypothetical protein
VKMEIKNRRKMKLRSRIKYEDYKENENDI